MANVREIHDERNVFSASTLSQAWSYDFKHPSFATVVVFFVVFFLTGSSVVMSGTITDSVPGAKGVSGAAQTAFASQIDDPSNLRFLGVVDNSTVNGVTIRTGIPVDTQFDLSDASKRPPVNAVTGRNVEGGNYKFNGDTAENTWEYFVSANPGESLTTIDFSGELWYAEGVNGNEMVHFELFTNDSMVSSISRNASAEGSSGNGQQEMDSMTGLLTDPGGPGVTSAMVRVYLDGNMAFESGSESFWTAGVLSAESVPEPSGILLASFFMAVLFRQRQVAMLASKAKCA